MTGSAPPCYLFSLVPSFHQMSSLATTCVHSDQHTQNQTSSVMWFPTFCHGERSVFKIFNPVTKFNWVSMMGWQGGQDGWHVGSRPAHLPASARHGTHSQHEAEAAPQINTAREEWNESTLLPHYYSDRIFLTWVKMSSSLRKLGEWERRGKNEVREWERTLSLWYCIL